MNRLQKKCAIATAGIHLLLLLVLVFGSAFFSPRPKPDDTQLLDVIPANLIDAALNSGVRQATPPAPAPEPVIVPPPQPIPPTPAVQPAPQPPEPKPVVTPPPTIPERLANFFKPEPKPVKPAPEKPEPKPHQIQVNTQLVARVPQKNPSTPDNPPRDTRALNNTLKNLRNNLSSPTEVTLPGNSSVAYASYRDALATIYYNAWITPNDMANDDAVTTVKITVASDGTVVNARIITPSGDAKSDDSVRRALDRVTSVPPLPDKSPAERDFVISFNLKAKRLLE
jgi:protein TonB